MKYLSSILFIILANFACFSQRQHIDFDNNWKFHFGHAGNPEKDFNYSIATIFSKTGGSAQTPAETRFVDSTWRTLNLPHDWAVELPFVNVNNFDVENHGYKPVGGLFPETSIGWYRKHFLVAKADSGSRFQLQFDGIFRDANVWINGAYLVNNKSGYVGFSCDISDFINFDKENVITVRVDATQNEGWFYEGAGIYRHVWLNKYSNAHIATDGVFTYSKVENNKAIISVETSIINEDLLAQNLSVNAYLADRNGKIVTTAKEQNLSLTINEEKITKINLVLDKPRLWNLDDPYLYRVIVEVKKGSTIIDKKTLKFGIKTINITKDAITLNGQKIKLLGVNNHQDHAGVGSALPDYLQYYRISLLKNMGVNAYRTSHNAPTPELLDACDSLGILVMDEHRSLNSGPEYMSQFERLLKRDRSRTSVFMWSIGNEESWIQTNSIGKRVALTLMAKQQQLDPTRTSTYAADLANVYQGVNEVIPVRSFNYRQFAVEAYHKDHPNQPIIGTEMGSTVTTRGVYEKDSIRAYLPDQDITAPWWASTAETWWKLAVNDYWLGGFIWTGMDYRGEPTPYHWPNISSHFGVMDVCGFPKNIYYYYQSWWTNKDVLHISPHWNLPDKLEQEVDVWVNSNADNVELFLNGKSQGKKDMPRNSHLQWKVKYETGKLEAIAYKNGKKLSTAVETTGLPTEVVLTPYKTTAIADGKDVSVINVSEVDAKGRTVPDADNLIRFYLKGDGKIIGVGNGDPSSHEPDKCVDGAWQRRLFNGHCQVIVQTGTKAENIKFEAKSIGLFTGSTDIITVLPDEISGQFMKKKE